MIASRRKRVSYTYMGSAPVELATFTFDGRRLLATYRDKPTEAMFARGISSSAGRIKPEDGAVFFDHLDDALARSSTMIVEDV